MRRAAGRPRGTGEDDAQYVRRGDLLDERAVMEELGRRARRTTRARTATHSRGTGPSRPLHTERAAQSEVTTDGVQPVDASSRASAGS